MKKRTFHTSINLLVEPGLYQKLKMTATLKKTSMCESACNNDPPFGIIGIEN